MNAREVIDELRLCAVDDLVPADLQALCETASDMIEAEYA